MVAQTENLLIGALTQALKLFDRENDFIEQDEEANEFFICAASLLKDIREKRGFRC